jgi:LPS export ABC transporter protein LptC
VGLVSQEVGLILGENKNQKGAKVKNFLIHPLLIAMSLLLTVGCSKSENKTEQKVQPEQVIKNFSAFETREGKKHWKLVAEEAKIFETKNLATLKNFSISFYSEDGKKISATLKAPSGKIYTNNNDFFTEGKTIIKTEKEKLECENVAYKSSLNKIFSDSNVKLIRQDAIVTGKGIEATPDLSSIIIKENLVEIKK